MNFLPSPSRPGWRENQTPLSALQLSPELPILAGDARQFWLPNISTLKMTASTSSDLRPRQAGRRQHTAIFNWAHFSGKKSFTTCMHVVHCMQGRLGCKHFHGAAAPSLLHWHWGPLALSCRDHGEMLKVLVYLCCAHLCCARRRSRGFKPHHHFALAAHLSFHPRSCSEPILVTFLELLLPSAIPWTHRVLHASGRFSSDTQT